MSTSKKKITKPVSKKRLIVSYGKLPEQDRLAFDKQYENGYSDYVQNVFRHDGTPMFVVPLETEENIYMVKVDVRIDSNINEEDFDKDVNTSKDADATIDDFVNSENGKGGQTFELNHGDYSSIQEEDEEQVAKRDMVEDSFSIDDLDVEDKDSILDL